MLLASLERQHEGTLVAVILGHADDAPWHLANQLLRTAHVAHVWTAPQHGNAQRLTVAHGNVCPPLAWCLQHGEVGCNAVDDEQCLVVVASVGKAREVLNDAIYVGLLNNDASHAALSQLGLKVLPCGHSVRNGQHHQLNPLVQGVGLQHLVGIRIDGTSHQHFVCLLARCYCHHHCLGTGRRAVVHRGVRYVHARQLGHHALVLKNVVQRAL